MAFGNPNILKSPLTRKVAGFLHAFTLIEMLVVVAVIGILITLLIPAATGVLKRGDRARMISLMRSTGTAMTQWSGENNNMFPAHCGPGRLPNTILHVRGAWSGYLLRISVLRNGPPLMWCLPSCQRRSDARLLASRPTRSASS